MSGVIGIGIGMATRCASIPVAYYSSGHQPGLRLGYGVALLAALVVQSFFLLVYQRFLRHFMDRIASPALPPSEQVKSTPSTDYGLGTSNCNRTRLNPRVYVMDLWPFIPYYVCRLCLGLLGQGVDTRICSVRYHLDGNYFRKEGLSSEPWLLDLGGDIRNALLRRIVKSMEYWLNVILLGRQLAKSGSSILHVQYLPFLDLGFPFEIWFLHWVRKHGVRIVYTVHNLTNKEHPNRHMALYCKAYHAAHLLVCHGQDASDQLVRVFGIPANKIQIIPHGPLFEDVPRLSPKEARAELGLPVDELLVLSMGVVREYKGLLFLLEAWKRLIESGCKARLLIAGTGDRHLMSAIRERVCKEGLESSVHLWLHYVPVHQVPLLHHAADILVYPYRAGTTSGALLTGLNYGKAVVATNLPFFKEYLRDGTNALLVNYGDVNALAHCLRTLLERPEKRSQIAAVLQSQNAQETSWNLIGKSTRECYENLLKGQERSS